MDILQGVGQMAEENKNLKLTVGQLENQLAAVRHELGRYAGGSR